MAAALIGSFSLAAQAQQPVQPMGTVPVSEARVTGGLEVAGTTARLVNNASVTAYDRAAPIALSRGGQVLVCSTSEFHLLHAGTNGSLIFGLDRGAIEIHSDSRAQDLVLTPDLKLTPVTQGPLDLRVRVTREGDTCVENSGATAPVLNASDPYSPASYRLLPGQHVLFVKGDLHRVVDHERSPCGCPTSALPQAATGKPLTKAQAAEAAHPFPAAQSEGLSSTTAPDNEAPVGTASSQVSTTFSYGADGGTPPPGSAATGSTASSTGSAIPPRHGFGAAVRRFFHKLFHPGSGSQ